ILSNLKRPLRHGRLPHSAQVPDMPEARCSRWSALAMSGGPLMGITLLLCCASLARAQTGDPLLSARSKGAATAPVTVYEMSDFQCPYCRRHAVEVLPELERLYIAAGKVRWVFINFPLTQLHPNASVAAEFAMCAAKAGKFWPIHDALFKYQEK